MKSGNWKDSLAPVVTAAVCFLLGFQYALGAPAAISDYAFRQLEDHSSFTILSDAPLETGLKFDRASRTLTIRFSGAEGAAIFEGLSYSDKLIEAVTSSKDEATGEILVQITFKTPNVSFYRTEATGAPGLTFNFRGKKAPLRIRGVTPDQMLAGKAAEPAPEAEKAAAPEPVEEPPAEAQKKPEQPSPEELERQRKMAQADAEYSQIELESGRADFLEFLKKLQKNEFEEARAAANSFLAQYPKSIYREKVYFMRGETMYLMAKRDKSLIPDALRSYNDALVRYPNSSMAPQAMMRRGSLYLDQEFNIEALTEFGSLLRTDPKGKYAVNAMLSSARIYMQQKKYVKAYNELEKILLLFPAHRQVRDVKYMMAETYHDRGQYDVADKIFAEAMKTWPTYPKTNPATFMKIADTSLKLGRINEALEDWYTIINLHPVSTEARVSMLNIADVYTEINKKKEAARTLENLVAKYPENKEAALARIRLASLGAENPELLKGSEIFDYTAFERPFKTLDDVINKFPDSKIAEEAMLRKGKAYSAQKRYISSVIAFKELLRTYPSARMSDEVFNLTQQSFLKMIGKFYEQDGFFTVLMTYYDNFDPFLRGVEDPVILAEIADSYSRLTLYDRALEYYRLANRYDEKGRMLPDTAFRIAKAYLDKSDYPEARRTMERYLKDFPKSPHAVTVRHMLGDALYELGRRTEAATEWRLAIEADPVNPRVSRSLYNLAFGYKTAGQYNMAVDSFNRAIDTYKPAIYTGEDDRYIKDSHFQLAEVYYLEQDYPNAIREARAARERYPEDKRNEWMDYIISISYERINMDELAMAKLEDLSRRDPSSPIGRVSTAKLKTYEWKMKNPELFID